MDWHFKGEQGGELIQLRELSAASANAETNKWTFYPKSDGWYTKDDAGNEYAFLTAGAGGAGVANRVAYWSAANTLTSSANFTFDGTVVTALQYLRVGTATDAAAQGDFSAGLTGAARLFYDQSAATEYHYNASNQIVNQISAVALTATVLNEQGADIDVRVEGDTEVNLLFTDASTDRVGIATSAPARRLQVNTASGTPQIRLSDGTIWVDLMAEPNASDVFFTLNTSNSSNKFIMQVNNTVAGTGVLFGNAKMGVWSTSNAYAVFAHSSVEATTGSYAIIQQSTGETFLNGATGTAVNFRLANSEWMRYTAAAGLIYNDSGAAVDLRIEGDSLAYMFFCNGSDATLENIALLTTAEPNWQSMDGGIFVGNVSTAPTGNPSSGGFLYSNAGAGTWRGSGGTVTAFGPAGPHCGNCGYDFWDVASENERWGAYLRKCGWCGKVYKKGPKSVLHLLDEQQRAELIYE